VNTPTSRRAACRARRLARRRSHAPGAGSVQRAQRDLLSTWGAVGFSPSALRASSPLRRRTTI